MYTYIRVYICMCMDIHVYVNSIHITHCKALQHTATHRNALQHTATHCNTLQHTATHCNALQSTATLHKMDDISDQVVRCNTLKHCNTLQHIVAHCTTMHTLQHTATHCNTLQHRRHRLPSRAESHHPRHKSQKSHSKSFANSTPFCRLGCSERLVRLCCSVLKCVAVCALLCSARRGRQSQRLRAQLQKKISKNMDLFSTK